MFNVFGNTMSVNKANKLKKIVDQFPEKFNSESSFEKVCNPEYDFDRLNFGIQNLDIDNHNDFSILESYLTKEINLPEFQNTLVQLGKVKELVSKHEDNKSLVPILTKTFTTNHAHIINGDNGSVEISNPYGELVDTIIGSSPYGIGEKRPDSLDNNSESLTRLSGEEFGVFLAERYARFLPYLKPNGSIYNIIDDYKLDSGEFSCSLEFFVIEMRKRGMYLVGRYCWEKHNPCPKGYADKDMVNGFEMIYRFSTNPKDYFTNTNIFIEKEFEEGSQYKKLKGCTNHSDNLKSTRGGNYVQSHLKKLRNTLSEQNCRNVIKGNVANPEDFFRQTDEHRHTSTAPIYLTSCLILESTKPGDVVLDIWNGVGNTMTSSLLLGRKYIGIEKEEIYYQQTCRRAKMTIDYINEVDLIQLHNEYQIAS